MKPQACEGCCHFIAGQGYVATSGPLTARHLIIGERPGQHEIAGQPPEPMIGPTGWAVNEALQGNRAATRVGNVRRCLTPEKESDAAWAASIAHCTTAYLHSELADLSEVRTITCVGGDALREIVGLPSITKVFGSVWTAAEAAAIRAAARPDVAPLPLPPKLHTVIAAIHPSAAMHGGRWMMPTIQQVINRGMRWSQREAGVGDRLAGRSFNLNPSPDEVEAALKQAEPCSIDVETPREDHGHILLCGVAPSPQHVLVFEWREPFVTLMREHLQKPSVDVIGFNFAFDMDAMWKCSGIDVRTRVFDGMNASAVLWTPVPSRKQEETGKSRLVLPWHSLALTTLRLFEDRAYWKEAETPEGAAFYGAAYGHRFAPYEWPRLYCGIDCQEAYAGMLAMQEAMKRD